jgi:N4-gp56 family major capsid protein
MDEITGTPQIPHAVNVFYSRTLLERAVPRFVHNRWAQIKDIPKKMTDSIKFRKYGAFTANTTPLSEGITPAGKKFSVTDILAQVQQYGDYTVLTDWIQLTTLDPLITEASEVLGEQAGDSLDQLTRNKLHAGTNVQCADVTSPKANVARDEIVSEDLLKADEVKIAVTVLKMANAKPITRMVNPDSGYATAPLDSCFIGIVDPETTLTLQDEDGFIPVEKYANKSKIMDGEIGSLGKVRFVETTNAMVFEGEGSGGIDVHSTLILGANAYGISRISGEALKTIVKSLGSGGTEDPLNQRSTVGWKATHVAKILQQLFMIRIEHAVAI